MPNVPCHVAWLLLLATAATGCTHYEPHPLPPAASAADFAQRSLDNETLRDALVPLLGRPLQQWPPQVWDRAQLLAVAIVQNPELAVVRSNVAVALSEQRVARELPNPGVTLQSEYARGEQYTWLYGVGFDFLLLSPQRRRLNLDIAQHALSRARWELAEKTWQVRRELAAALADWQLARARQPLLEQLLQAQQRLLVIQQRRVAAGEDAPSEVSVSQLALLQAQQQQAATRLQQFQAQAAVAAVLGVPPEALDHVSVDWSDWGAPPPLDEASLPGLREQALLGRADLAQAIDEYAASEDRLQLEVARQYPQLQLEPGYYWDHGIAKWPLNLGLTLPLFNRNQGEIAAARASREVSGQHLLAVQAEIYGAIATAARADGLAADAAASSARQEQLAAEQSRRAELGLHAGAIDSSERFGAQVVALRAALDALGMRAERQAVRNALEDALHAPLSGPERELGAPLLRSLAAAPVGNTP
ncbi:MAG: TolC family protein [Sinobacteraceae bacterium]|nr:TolC family protein [Nevskiaceae bacterium]